jgi:hypothetical protein
MVPLGVMNIFKTGGLRIFTQFGQYKLKSDIAPVLRRYRDIAMSKFYWSE